MSNRAAVSFLSSISLGGSQHKKEPSTTQLPIQQVQQVQSQPQQQPQQSQQNQHHHHHHHSHREHFKAKLSNHLEKKHLIHRHDKDKDKQPAATPAPTTTPVSSAPTSQKPAIHPNSLKRSNSSTTMGNEYNSSSNLVIRSTSGTAIPNRGSNDNREPIPSPRDKSPRDPDSNLNKSRNNSVDQGTRTCHGCFLFFSHSLILFIAHVSL